MDAKLKRLLALISLTGAFIGPVAGAQAQNESIGLSLEARPSAGALFREVERPVDASLTVTVTAPSGQPTVTPLKVANVTFPSDMGFFPDASKTPACGEDALNDQSNLAGGVADIVALCPRSVVGTGTAVVQLGKLNLPQFTLVDPRLVIFNAGRNEAGRPRITIYGYSKTVNSGLLMHGVLATDGELKIAVGVLPADSSVSQFTLGIPGDPIEVEDPESGSGTSTFKGLDPQYLRATCSTGTWTATGAFVLGERAYPSGDPTGTETMLDSNPFSLPCDGRPGRPKLRIDRIKGPSRIDPGGKGRFVVKVTNFGTATARKLTVASSGAATGTRRDGSLAPGATRNIALRVKAKRGGPKGRLKLKITALKAIPAKSVRKLSVR